MANPVVPEIEVLIASAVYLWGRGARPISMSISRGSRAGRLPDRQRLKTELQKAGIADDVPIYDNGEDLVAASATELWYVECKGSPSKDGNSETEARAGTHWNQFDRALSSLVSDYDKLQEETKAGATAYLGLALPLTDHYLKRLKHKLGKRLRARLNIWVLLYDAQAGTVSAISPNEDYPN